MPSGTTTGDLTLQYKSYIREYDDYRPLAATTYLPGSVVQIAPMDSQPYPDAKGIQLCNAFSTAGVQQNGILGVVGGSGMWSGFDGNDVNPTSFTSPSNLLTVRGSQSVPVVHRGYVDAILLDQTATGAVTVVDKSALIVSKKTAGYAMGGSLTAPVGNSYVVGEAMLPAAGIGSSITAAALAQASQTATIVGPVAGDQPYVTIQSPYSNASPGVAQTIQYLMPPLTAAQAVSATTAAAAMVAFLNSIGTFSAYFLATNVAGVVTVTVNTLAAPWHVNGGVGTTLQWEFNISLSGMIANSLTFAAGVVGSGGTTNTAGGANFTGGTGFTGSIPGRVACALV